MDHVLVSATCDTNLKALAFFIFFPSSPSIVACAKYKVFFISTYINYRVLVSGDFPAREEGRHEVSSYRKRLETQTSKAIPDGLETLKQVLL